MHFFLNPLPARLEIKFDPLKKGSHLGWLKHPIELYKFEFSPFPVIVTAWTSPLEERSKPTSDIPS